MHFFLITARKVLQKHRLNKARLLIKINVDVAMASGSVVSESVNYNCSVCQTFDEKVLHILPMLVEDIPSDVKEVIILVFGYVAFKCYTPDDAIEDTYDEYYKYCSYFNNVNRGKLKIPHDSLVTYFYYVYITLVSLLKHDAVSCSTCLHMYCVQICEIYDLVEEDKQAAVIRTICNIMLNNYIRSREPPESKESLLKVAKLAN